MQTISYEEVLLQLQVEGCAMGAVHPVEYHKWKGQLAAELGMPVTSKSELADFAANRYAWKLAKEAGVRKTSAALELGALVDCLTLTPSLYEEQYLCEPKRVALKKDGTPYANRQQDPEQKAEWEAAAAAGKRVLSPEEYERAATIAVQATAHLRKLGLEVGETCATQVGMWVCLNELGGVQLATPVVVCGMLDLVPVEGERLMDLKTTSKDVANGQGLIFHAEDFAYGVQAAMYLDMYNLCMGAEVRQEFSFLFVGTGEPVQSREMVMRGDTLDLYRAMYMEWVSEFARACAEDDWGTPELDELVYEPSRRLCAMYNEQ